jgi:diguanylate cyclase (GGDEF)-like protein
VLDAAMGRRPFGLLLLELDRFASINDSYGHEVGDRLLRSLAEQLERLARPGETVARWGGPQFALVLPGAPSPDAVGARAAELQHALNVKVRISHDTLLVTATVGAVAVDDRFRDTAEVANAAATALAVARVDGRGGMRTFDRTMSVPLSATAASERLGQAGADEHLLVLYEPVVSLADRGLAGIEGVLHWVDPERGILRRDQLGDVLERGGIEHTVTESVLDQVVAQAGAWHRAHPALTVSAHVPASLLVADGFVDRLHRRITDAGANARELCLNIESRARSDLFDLWTPMRELTAIGVQVGLDEFGVGWSSLTYLRRFTVDVLKLPASLTATIAVSRSDEAVAQQLISLAKGLGVVPIADGITDRAQADLLVSLGCELGQGPLYGGPQPASTIETYLARGKVDPVDRRGGSINWSATTG